MKPLFRVIPSTAFKWKLQKRVLFWWKTVDWYLTRNAAIEAARHLTTPPVIIK